MARLEDLYLLRGEGRFIDDLGVAPGTLHAAFVRAPLAHAAIKSIDTAAALAMPGIRAVVTGEDAAKFANAFVVGVKAAAEHRCLALGKVRYVGEPVAIVCAEDPYLAEDAAGLVEVVYEALPAVADCEAAVADASPLLHEALGSNVISDRSFSYGDPEGAFAAADDVVEIAIRYPRNSLTPIECYGVVADYSPAQAAYDVVSNFSGPFALHPVMALALKVPGTRLRLRSPQDSGGSFGTKQGVFPYIVALCVASRIAGAPVKWIEDRLEHLSAATSATNRVTRLKAAITRDGRITALDYDQIDDCGAYLRAPEPATIYRMHGNMTGAYDIASLAIRNRVVLTNKTPTGLVRGFGGPQVYFPLERLVHKIALKLGLPQMDIIARNLIHPDAFPYRNASGGIYDSGNYQAALALAEEQEVLSDLEARRAKARSNGLYYGIGIAAIVEPSISNMGYITTVLTHEEREKAGAKGGALATATVAVDPLGGVSVHASSVPQGQGHRTALAQVVADALGLALDDISVAIELDTGRDAWSVASGNYSSRFAGAVAGSAHLAATRLKARLVAIAAAHLGCEAGEVTLADGAFAGPGKNARPLPFRRLAASSHWAQATLPQGMEPVVRETVFWSPDVLTAPNAADEINSSAAHGFVLDICGLEIDPKTCRARVDRYVTIHDAGRLINPAMANGQVQGGFSNGLGAALYEQFVYGRDGSFLTGTFADYPVVAAPETPRAEIHHIATPSPVTPLGAKGIGEGNCMSTPVCIANAAADALGLEEIELPLTPSRLHALIAEGEPPAPAAAADKGDGLALSKDGYAVTGDGAADVAAGPEQVWDIILDPRHLAAVIPGCKSLEKAGDGRYVGDVVLGVGMVKGLFRAEVRITDTDRPRRLRLGGEAAGRLGTAGGEGVVTLTPHEGGCRIAYAYGADVSGKVAAVGGRMIESAGHVLIGEFFKRLAARAAPGAAGEENPGIVARIRRLFRREGAS